VGHHSGAATIARAFGPKQRQQQTVNTGQGWSPRGEKNAGDNLAVAAGANISH